MMAKGKMDELFTPYEQRAALAEPRPPRVVRVRLVDGEARLDALGRYWPVPTWTRRLDGLRLRTLALALVAVAGAVALWRLVVGAGR